MQGDLQKASLWKRIAAGILDLILIVVLATGFGWMLSSILNYDSYHLKVQQIYDDYSEKYQLDPNILEKFHTLSEEEQQAYQNRVDQANAAIENDAEANRALQLVINLSLIIATGGVLIAVLLSEFTVPLLFKNGQTVGKKIFSLCVIRTDGVKMNHMQHFTRVILGKFAVEMMIPVYGALMYLLNQLNLTMIFLMGVLLIAELIILAATRTNALLHDLMAGTVVVDYSSQRIFKSTEDLIAYQKRIAAERAARQIY